MKKTVLTLGFVVALGLMLSGCSGSSESTTESMTENTTEVETTTSEETTVSETTEAQLSVEDYPAINKNAVVGNGYITFVADNKNYYFDVLANKTYEYSGYIVGGRVAFDNGALVNVVTGETIATNVDTTFYGFASWAKGNARNIIQVVTKEDTYKIGALDSLTGEWVSPLKEYEGVIPAEYGFRPDGGVGNIVTFDCGVKLNLLNGKDVIGKNAILAGTNEKVLFEDVSDSSNFKLYMYNTSSDETVLLDNADVYMSLSYNGLQKGIMLRRNANSAVSYLLFDEDLNQINIDLSKYDIQNFFGINDSYIVFTANNPNGESYLVVLDRSGNEVMEPIKAPTNIALTNSGLAYSDYTSMTYLDNSGNKSEHVADEIFFSDVDLSTGMTVRKSNGKYYFVDIKDPETLIHPLAYLVK